MTFNLGYFGGGFSQGMNNAFTNMDKLQEIRLRRQALQDWQNQQAAQAAYGNYLYPGSTPVPQPGGGEQPFLSKVPILGDIGGALGLWDQPPEAYQPGMPQQPMATGPQAAAGPPPRIDLGGGAPPQGPATAVAPPQAPAQPAAPQAAAGMPPGMGEIAAAVDRANPGLRARNPQAFISAVQMVYQQQTGEQTTQLTADKTRAGIDETKAKTGMYAAHGDYYNNRVQAQSQGNKELTTMFKENEAGIRNLRNQRSRIATAFDISKPEKKQMLEQLDGQIAAYESRRDIIVRQMRGEESTEPTKFTDEQKANVLNASKAANPNSIALDIPNDKLSQAKELFKSDPQKFRQMMTNLANKGVSKETLEKFFNMVQQP